MTLVQTEPKKIYIWSTEIKKVYLWSTQIRPAGWWWWQPWANTLLYIPMDTASGTTDQSSYHRTYTVSWLTHITLDGVDCYQTSSSSYINLWTSAASWLVPSSKEFTAHFWINTNGYTSTQSVFQWAVQGSYFTAINIRDTDKVRLGWGTPGIEEWNFLSDNAISRNAWHLLSFTIGNWIDKLYVDGVLQSNTKSWWTNDGFWAWHVSSQNGIYILADRAHGENFRWYVWQIVMEDIERTAQEISDYYDLTKWNYWL